jgi:hypothetical protein
MKGVEAVPVLSGKSGGVRAWRRYFDCEKGTFPLGIAKDHFGLGP